MSLKQSWILLLVGWKFTHCGTNKAVSLSSLIFFILVYQHLHIKSRYSPIIARLSPITLSFFYHYICFIELFIVFPSIYFLSLFILHSESCCCWNQSQLFWGKGGVTPCTSRGTEHFTLAFTRSDNSVKVKRNWTHDADSADKWRSINTKGKRFNSGNQSKNAGQEKQRVRRLWRGCSRAGGALEVTDRVAAARWSDQV